MQIQRMNIQTLQWHHYRVPLHATFTSAHEVLGMREGVIIEIHTDTGLVGIGESAPLPNFTRTQNDTVQHVITHLTRLAQHLPSLTVSTALQYVYEQTGRLPPTARYALETALLDLLGQQSAEPLSVMLTRLASAKNHAADSTYESRLHIPVNAVIGARTLADTVTQAQLAVKQGFRCLKLKIGTAAHIEQEVERIRAVRAAVGPAIQLRLDANEALDFEQACTLLTRCEDYKLQYVEQPLPREQLAEMQRLRERVAVPLAADEAISDVASAQHVLAAQAADILIIKPQLAGGLRSGRQIIQAATTYNVPCIITSSIDTGIGITGALHLAAASPEVTLACGLATLNMLADDLISESLHVEQGMLTFPTRPGLGVQLDRAALTRYSQ